MDITMYEATLGDLDVLVETRIEVLRAVFGLPENFEVTDLVEANRNYYREAIPDGSHLAGLAYLGNEFVACAGVCFFQQMPSPDSPSGNCAFVMNVYTRPRFRRQGIAEKMMEWIFDQAKQRGVDRVFLEATPEGRKVYERLGFVLIKDCMEKVFK